MPQTITYSVRSYRFPPVGDVSRPVASDGDPQ